MRLKASAKNLLLPNVTLNTMISANKEYFLITDDDDDDGPEWESKPMEQIIQVKCEDEDGGPKTKVLAKVSRQSRTVAGSTEGRKRSRSSSSRREESREESTETITATAAGIGICSSSVRRSAPRRQQLGQRGGTATSTPSLWHGML